MLDKEIRYLHICLFLFFLFVKNNPMVKSLNIFKHELLYIAYADDTSFFLKEDRKIYVRINE